MNEECLAIIAAIYGIEIPASYSVNSPADSFEYFWSNGRECVTLAVIVADLNILLFHFRVFLFRFVCYGGESVPVDNNWPFVRGREIAILISLGALADDGNLWFIGAGVHCARLGLTVYPFPDSTDLRC